MEFDNTPAESAPDRLDGSTGHHDSPHPLLGDGPTRRNVVLGAGVVGMAGVLAACGGGGSTTGSDGGDSSAAPGSSAGGSDTGLVKTSQVPVGNGVILEAQKVVVVQPTAGDFKAFSAVCTHMACTVATIKNGTISCPCHGSTYSAKDGSVTGGPAPRPLKSIAVKVDGDEIVRA